MSKNQHSSHKSNEPIVIGVIIGGLVLIGFAGWIFISWINHPSLSERLTSTIREHTMYPEFFTKSKLIEKYDAPIYENINGDGEMGGTFQLSKVEVETLLRSGNLIECSPSENCQRDTLKRELDCDAAIAWWDTIYSLCVDSSSNQVEWSVTWT
jgi:hypothetical protein